MCVGVLNVGLPLVVLTVATSQENYLAVAYELMDNPVSMDLTTAPGFAY